MSVIIIVVVLFFTYYCTRALSKKMNSFSTSKYIKIIDKVAIGQNKFLLIVQVEGKSLLLSVTDNSINILKELDGLGIEDIELKDGNNIKFSEILKDNLLKNKIASKFMKGNNCYESVELDKEKEKK